MSRLPEMTTKSRQPEDTSGPAGSHTDHGGLGGQVAPSRLGLLTTRELGVVELLLEGLTNPQIAQQLGISRRTVSSHLSAIFRKLRVRSRIDLILQAPDLRPQVEKLQRSTNEKEVP